MIEEVVSTGRNTKIRRTKEGLGKFGRMPKKENLVKKGGEIE